MNAKLCIILIIAIIMSDFEIIKGATISLREYFSPWIGTAVNKLLDYITCDSDISTMGKLSLQFLMVVSITRTNATIDVYYLDVIELSTVHLTTNQRLCNYWIWMWQSCNVFSDITLQWCHNDHDDVSNHQPHDCLLNRLFRRRSRKTSKLRVKWFNLMTSSWNLMV